MPATGEGRDYGSRYVWVLGVAYAAFLILGVRLYLLQVAQGEYFAARSRSNVVKEIPLAADRGMVLDANGTIVADARPAWDVFLTPAFCEDPDATLRHLEEGLQLPAGISRQAAEKVASARGLERFRPIRVARNVGRDALDWAEAHSLELDGVDIHVRPRRHYRYGPSLYHVLGYMNEIGPRELERAQERGLDYRLGDSIGRSGLEEIFEDELRGTDGLEKVVVDAKGRRLAGLQTDEGVIALIPEAERIQPAVPGHNLVLSIDARLQETLEEVFPGRAGAVVVVDPQTGFIRAMLSRPAPDPNRLTAGITRTEMRLLRDDPLEPMLHRAIQQHYHPGSTFKVFTALAALEQGIGTEEATHCNGGYRMGRRRWRCWRAAGHGTTSLNRAIQHSCDTYFYWVSDRIDIDPIAKWARAAGLGSKTECGLPHEVPGIIPDVAYHDRVSPDGYTRGFALNTSIGQGDVNVTPLQLVMAYAAIANGGTVYQPQLALRIEDAQGKTLRSFAPKVRQKMVVDPEHLAAVRAGLRAVVMEPGGTAYYRYPRREGFTVEVAGKTGTAQVVKLGEEREKAEDLPWEERDHAWFAAFAPVEQAEIAVVVLNEHGGHGSSGAAPTAMKVIQRYFELKALDAAQRAGADEPAPARSRDSEPPAGLLRPPEGGHTPGALGAEAGLVHG
ncbi:MAG: penicillin-binding protein 2 [Deltaproteobacteria bacterium]|nr:penicillin-binding protein 2 [Deltaproteobacteria bacterium]